MNYYDYYDTSSVQVLGMLAGIGVFVWIISLAACILMIVSMWKIFKKAGKNGWESIVPVYNIIVLFEICKIDMWKIVFYIIPIAQIYIMFKQYIELAKKFGKDTGFGVLTTFFPVICLPILAFGNAKYEDEPQTSFESDASILDVNETGVPNNSEAKDFTYGYEKEETVVIPQVNPEESKNDSKEATDTDEKSE